MGKTQGNQNYIHEKINREVKSANAGCLSVLNLLSSSLLSRRVKIKIYRTIVLLFVLYGCETWSLTLKEEYRLRVFENRVLRRIFGPRRHKVTGAWRRLDKEELYFLYSSPSIIRVIKSRRLRWTGHIARMGERSCAYRVLVGTSKGRRPLGRTRHRSEDIFKTEKWVGVSWTGSIWLRIGTVGWLL
jgi:hypothetical protein